MDERKRNAFSDAAERERRRSGPFVLLGGLGLAVAGSAAAQTASLHDTGRILEYMGTECAGQPGCVTVESGKRRIAPGQQPTVVRLRCPANHPYVVGWDTEQHEHITAVATLGGLPSNPGAAFARAPGSEGLLALQATNNADAAGSVTLFLGCSAEPSRGTAFRRMRSGVPSNAGAPTGRRQ